MQSMCLKFVHTNVKLILGQYFMTLQYMSSIGCYVQFASVSFHLAVWPLLFITHRLLGLFLNRSRQRSPYVRLHHLMFHVRAHRYVKVSQLGHYLFLCTDVKLRWLILANYYFFLELARRVANTRQCKYQQRVLNIMINVF